MQLAASSMHIFVNKYFIVESELHFTNLVEELQTSYRLKTVNGIPITRVKGMM